MKIADNIDFDLDTFLGQRAIFQAAPGGGKSTGARLILEAAYGRFQELILDVDGDFHTLRTEDRDYAIIGGDNGDAPLGDIANADQLALTLLRLGVSVVIQIDDLPLEKQRIFVGKFAAGLMQAPRELWHPVLLMLDEAHYFVPEGSVESSTEAVTFYATGGRKRGFSALFATTRLSLFSKDVLGACANKFLGRVEQAADRKAAADQLGFTAKSAEALEMQSFRAGEFYCVGPALCPTPVKTRLFMPKTRVPKPGTPVLPSPTPAAIQKALSAIAASAPKTVDPAVVAGAPTRTSSADIDAAFERGKRDGYSDGHIDGYADGIRDTRQILGQKVLDFAADFALATADPFLTPRKSVAAAMSTVKTTRYVDGVDQTKVVAMKPSATTIQRGVPSGEDPLLSTAISIWPAKATWSILAAMCGRKARGGHFNTARKRLIDSGFVREEGDLVVLVKPPPRSEGMIQADLLEQKLPQPAQKMFATIRKRPGITLIDLGEALHMQPRGGHWNTGLSILRKNGLIAEVGAGLRILPSLEGPHA